jgi:hypothetical protein
MASVKERDEGLRRSTKKYHMIREVKNAKGEVVEVWEDWLPGGRGWLRGNEGPIDWINLGIGWRPYDEYMAEKNRQEADAKRDALIAEQSAKLEAAEKKIKSASKPKKKAVKAEPEAVTPNE